MQVEIVNMTSERLRDLLMDSLGSLKTELETIKKELQETKACLSSVTEKEITAEELAKIKNCERQTIINRAKKGSYPFRKEGKSYMFKLSEIEKATL